MSEDFANGNRCFSVIMPAYNESLTVSQIIGLVLAQPMVAHSVNQGKGAALRTGIAETRAERTYEEGKKIGWRDGVSALIAILKYHFPR